MKQRKAHARTQGLIKGEAQRAGETSADAADDLVPAQERVYASVGSSLAHTAVSLVSLKPAERADVLFF